MDGDKYRCGRIFGFIINLLLGYVLKSSSNFR